MSINSLALGLAIIVVVLIHTRVAGIFNLQILRYCFLVTFKRFPAVFKVARYNQREQMEEGDYELFKINYDHELIAATCKIDVNANGNGYQEFYEL